MIDLPLEENDTIPIIGLGTWLLNGQQCVDAVKIGLELGYRHIDTAQIYENHEQVAEGMAGFDRSQLFLTSKLWMDDLQPDRVLPACERCLRELKTDYLDLFLIHWPSSTIPLGKTLDEMVKLKNQGKVKHIGLSNCTIKLIKENADYPICNNQVELHPYLYQKELIEYCNNYHITVTAYSPLARGKIRKNPQLIKIAEKHGKSVFQIALRWLVQKNVIVVPKASTREHLQDNIDLFDFELSGDDMGIIDRMNQNYRIIAPEWNLFDEDE